jgi:hypothetical protein
MTLNNAMSNTPWSPARQSQGRVQTWVTSQRKLLAFPGQFSTAINMRSWNGGTITVIADDQGFLFEDRTYRSLSAIAKEVTGAHWSGPRFFGLTGSGQNG